MQGNEPTTPEEIQDNPARRAARERYLRAVAKDYLGDGAYVEFDGYHFVLTAENGIRATDTVALEPGALAAFERKVAEVKAAIKEMNGA